MPTYLFSTSTTSYPNTTNVKSLSITLLKPKIDFTIYDYFIISSKQISKALMAYEKEEYIDKKALCVSSVSAQSYVDLGGKVLDESTGYGDTFVEIIKNYPMDTKWLYLRGEKIASDFAKVCRNDGYDIAESILYKSECSTDVSKLLLENDSTLIFTSPSTIECFLKVANFKSSYKVIVIGKTTAQALPENIDYQIACNTTIEACLALVKSG